MSSRPAQDEIGYVVKQLQQELRAHMDRALGTHDMTMSSYAALAVLVDDDELSNAELARRCFVTPQTMHRIVGELESAGLVARHPDPDHGRIRRTRLTDDGRARVADCRPDVDLVQDRMLSDLSSPETAQLGDFLARCLAALRDD